MSKRKRVPRTEDDTRIDYRVLQSLSPTADISQKHLRVEREEPCYDERDFDLATDVQDLVDRLKRSITRKMNKWMRNRRRM